MSETRPIPLWLDCDPGHDDAFAILLAAYNGRLDLLGISTVYGNAPLSKTTDNALSILQAIGRNGIHVYPGASKPFNRATKHAPQIHGESGLDGTSLLPQPNQRPLSHCNAVKEMRDALMACRPRSAWLVATGALTNVALLFAVYPEVAKHIKGLSIMGGAVGGDYTGVYMGPEYTDSTGKTHARIGNMSPFAEFNIWCDPESAKSIFTSPNLQDKTTLITLDLTHQVCATVEERDVLRFSRVQQEPTTKLRQMFYELLMFFAKTYEDVFGLFDGPPLHDPIAVAVLLNGLTFEPEALFDDSHKERWLVNVVTEGEQVGRTEVHLTKNGIFVPRSINLKAFWTLLEDSVAKADEATGFVKV